MKTAVFVDTDVILDLLTRREPFYQASAQLFSLADRGEIRVYVSSLCFANLYYILRKALTGTKAVETLKKFRQLVTVLPVDDHVLCQALDSGFTDFEDALQYHAAMRKGVSCLVTRNVKDYRKAGLTICTAGEFLAGLTR